MTDLDQRVEKSFVRKYEEAIPLLFDHILRVLEKWYATPRPDVEQERELFYTDLMATCFRYALMRPFMREEWSAPTDVLKSISRVWDNRCGCWMNELHDYQILMSDHHWRPLCAQLSEERQHALCTLISHIQSRVRIYVWRAVVGRLITQRQLAKYIPHDLAWLVGVYVSVTVDDRYRQLQRAVDRLPISYE